VLNNLLSSELPLFYSNFDGDLNRFYVFFFWYQLHLVCVVPPFKDLSIKSKLDAEVLIVSGGKTSEPHPFVYTPLLPSLTPLEASLPDVTGPAMAAEVSLPKGVAPRKRAHTLHPLLIDVQTCI
jgi:hypothetical protein